MIKKVSQEFPTSCGIACVASVTNHTHGQIFKMARKLFNWPDSQRTFYTGASQIRDLCHQFSFNTERPRRIARWASMPGLAIAAINYRENKNGVGYWHWVVFLRYEDVDMVLDPRSKRNIRRDFEKMRLHLAIPLNR